MLEKNATVTCIEGIFFISIEAMDGKRIANINDPAGLQVVFNNPMQYSVYVHKYPLQKSVYHFGNLHKEVIKVT